MSFRTTISFHPKLAAALDLLFGLVLVWWVGKIGALWLFGVWWLFRAAWWFGLLGCMYYPPFLSRALGVSRGFQSRRFIFYYLC